jgi:hypothetical protein
MGSASAAEATDPVPIARTAASNTLESMSLMEIPPLPVTETQGTTKPLTIRRFWPRKQIRTRADVWLRSRYGSKRKLTPR